MTRFTLALLITCSLSATSLAHDFWIRPSSFTPVAGANLDVVLEIGHPGDSERYARNPGRIERFFLAGPGEKGPQRDIPGAPGADPAGSISVAEPGLYIVGYDSNHAHHEMPADKFENYLREEGLDTALAYRAANAEAAATGREIYSRCAKALVRVAPAADAAASAAADTAAEQPLGFPAEVVPVGDPTRARIGDQVTFRVLRSGAPIAGAQVHFVAEREMIDHAKNTASKSHADEPGQHARTDAQGVVRFTITTGGLHLVNSVVIERLTNNPKADWESWWASLTFEPAGN